MTYVAGDFWRICDVCGFKTRSSKTAKRWDGLIVCFADFEERHPQDFVRGRADRQNVPDPRPEPADSISGRTTITTAAALPGSSQLIVESSAGFLAGHHIGILLSDGTLFRAIILIVQSTSSIIITTPLPSGVLLGALVIDYDDGGEVQALVPSLSFIDPTNSQYLGVL